MHFHLLVANVEPSGHEFCDYGGVSMTFAAAGESNAYPIDGVVLVLGHVWEAAEEPLSVGRACNCLLNTLSVCCRDPLVGKGEHGFTAWVVTLWCGDVVTAA